MNPFIKEQLNLVRVANLPPFDDTTLHLIIPRSDNDINKSISIGKNYIIELASYIVNPSENFNLHDNWNNGNIPKYIYLKCSVEAILGKMIKIKSNAIDMKTLSDIDYKWEGWLPYKSITIIKELG